MGTHPFVTQRATEWLLEQLADGQPKRARVLIASALAVGIAKRTLQRVSTEELPVVKVQRRVPERGWFWQLASETGEACNKQSAL